MLELPDSGFTASSPLPLLLLGQPGTMASLPAYRLLHFLPSMAAVPPPNISFLGNSPLDNSGAVLWYNGGLICPKPLPPGLGFERFAAATAAATAKPLGSDDSGEDSEFEEVRRFL